ncbi:unnamed protein product [Dracunculus medinensis]|uniref:Aldolase_II domain-containing protein n=1 Tax=Dracunculus medinensis TaxID=318479 RepID=A0A158Q416_DRAME|nr:unnamed protein product [Dracunculus medinensis]
MPGESNGTTSNGDLQGTFRNFDPEDPEYIKDLQRPAAIKEDLSEMERRKRVQKVLESKEFCRELEELIKHDNCKSDVDVIKRLSQLTLPYGQLASISLHNNVPSMPILPIADLRGNENYSRAEKIIRNKLASLYRLVDIFQWSQGIYNHITLRISADNEQILINPFGLLYHEITASSLIKINFDGDILDQGSTKLGINQAGYVLHSAIHKARRDVNCVLHLHTPVVSAVSSMKSGLLPICQEALIIGPIAYHDYKGILNDENEKESIVQDLGDKNVMLLRNHGFVVCGSTAEEALHLAFNTIIAFQILFLRTNGFVICGETIEEAVYLVRNLIGACDHQIRAMRAGLENLVIPDEKAVERAYKTAKHGSGGVNRSPCKDAEGKTIYWRIGELEWEAWMRVLDNAGYRTGHIYKQAGLRTKSLTSPSKTGQSDIAIPPSASSMGSVDESDYESVTAHKIALLRKEQEKARWLNSPNAYQRIEILETGTDNPKKITKWIQDVNSPQHNGTPVKISSPHQFSPFSINPKEFKEKQKAIKETRLLGATSAGPQSQILDGVTYEEIVQMRADNSAINQTDRIVMIGTASKGIIERQHQHNAQSHSISSSITESEKVHRKV